ncbi:MAG: amidohydrolase family protein [Gemmatimonadales bacterium]
MFQPSVRAAKWVAAAVILWPAQVMAQQAVHHPTYAIENARIVPVSGRTIDNGTIVLANGVITAVGPKASVPKGATVIDGSGLTVYPGLIDALSTIGLPRPAGTNGRPAARGGRRPGGANANAGGSYSHGPQDRPATFTWVMAADQLKPDSKQLETWRNGGFTSAVAVPDRGFFPGHAALIDLAGERPNDMVVKTPVALRMNLRGGPGHRGYPSSLMGAFAYVKQLFLDASYYATVRARYEANPRGHERPAYDRALEPLTAVRDGQEKLLFPASSATEIKRAIRTSAEIGVNPVIYGVHSGYEVAQLLAERQLPVLVSLNWPKAKEDADPETDTPLRVLRFRLLAPTTPAALAKAGVRFAFYSDSLKNPSQVLAAVRKATEAGLPADAAIRALTLSAAEIFGADDRLGSLDEGKIANAVVTDGDLLDEGTKVKMVFVDGERFEPNLSENGTPRMARGDGTSTEGDGKAKEKSESGPSDTELRSRIGPSFRGPYRDDAVTLIKNATVLTITNGTVEGGSVLIRNGKIAAVGTDIPTPRGAHVIDASGQYVMPGIIDAHSHIAGGSNEGSVSVSAMVGIKDVINPDDINIYRALAGGVTTVDVLHGSANPIGGKNAVIKLRWGADADGLLLDGAPPGIKFALGENPKRDRNPDRYPATRMGVMDVIRSAFVDAKQYKEEWDAYAERKSRDKNALPPRRDLKLESLAEVLEGKRLVHAHSYRADEILQLMRLAEEFDFRIATFQHVLEGYKVAKEIAAHGAGASTFSDWWAYKVEAYDAIPYNAAIMTEKGVTVSINSDSPEEMRHLNEEAAKTVKWGGLSETQALSLVTINPAKQLRVDKMVGSIEVGKDADLVIYNRNPLDNLAVVQQTFVDGKLYFDIDGDRERQHAIDAEKKALEKAPKPKRPRVTTEPQSTGEIIR